MSRVTLDTMPRGEKDSEPPKTPPKDQHVSGFMTRLPERYRDAINEYRKKHAAQHRFRPPMTAVIQLALDEFLAKHGIVIPIEEDP